MVLMHGGGSNLENLRATPVWFAEMLSRCGFIVVVYDKHGLGESGGNYAISTFDDYVDDAGHAAAYLSQRKDVDDSRIGILGFSQGGRLAPVAAVRYPHFSFVASVSGPIASVKETRLYALKSSYREAEVPDEVLHLVMPIWDRYLDAVAERSTDALAAIARIAEEIDDGFGGALLPPTSGNLPTGGIFNSMGRDYTEELVQLDVPWFSLYGSEDLTVPVKTSTANIKRIRKASGNYEMEYLVIKGVGHSFSNADDTKSHAFEINILAWLFEQADIEIHPTGGHSGDR